jgi:DNA replication licensing factor MCM7
MVPMVQAALRMTCKRNIPITIKMSVSLKGSNAMLQSVYHDSVFLTREQIMIVLYCIVLYCISTATFTSFLLEHTILQVVRDNDDDDDDDRLLEPTDGNINVQRVPCYTPLLQRIVDREYADDSSTTFLVETPLSELVDWDATRGGDLAQRATDNALRYHALFGAVVDQLLQGLEPSPRSSNNTSNTLLRDTMHILHEQRLAAQQRSSQPPAGMDDNNETDALGGVAQEAAQNHNATGNVTQDFPPLLLRRYELRILPLGRRGTLFPFVGQHLSKHALPPPQGVSLRHVRSKSMGRLVTLTGMVVRASDVKPYCHVATYSCDDCGAEVYQVLNNQREFMPQRTCPACAATNRRQTGTLQLQTRGSKFVKFQELKLQELPSQVPMGHIPRSLGVYCRGELTRMANPGDVITVDGVFLPQRVAEGGYRAMKAGLMATLFLEAQHIDVDKKTFDKSILETLGEEDSAQLDADIQSVATSEDPIAILGASIAPEIFGHADIKRALLLQLTGGVSRKLPDGMRIRGDINICLMGDPGVAKSQLLKHVASVAPRGVYTTGKGSSGVGLTAAVTKDTVTGEMSLEGGALVLADRGICAIVSSPNLQYI